MRIGASAFACAALLAGACASAYGAEGRRVPCNTVVGEIDRADELAGSAPADPVEVAERLRTDPFWVERCAQVYGRRLAARPRGENREDRSEAWESEELEEIAPEERAAQGELYPGDVAEEKTRKKLPGEMREWNPTVTHEWDPVMPPEWEPFLLDNDLPPPGSE